MGFGKPKYGYQKVKKNYFSVTEEAQVFGIFPPMFSLEDDGHWSKFYSVHFGYKNMEGKLRTFVSPLKKSNKGMIDVRDAALERIEDLKAKMEKAKEEGKTEVFQRLFKLVGQSKTNRPVYNLDKNHHMNVHTLDGKIGTLKMRHKCKLALDAEIERLQNEGIDPLDPQNGRYFVFRRIGNGAETTFKVDVYEQVVTKDGKKYKEECIRTISPELERRAERGEASDLNKLFATVTEEECEQIVKESDLLTGKSPACNRIFDDRWKAARDAKNAAQESKGSSGATTTSAVADAEMDIDQEEPSDDYSAPTSSAPAAPAPTQAAQTNVAQEAQAATTEAEVKTAPAFEELSDDDFFAQIGVSR